MTRPTCEITVFTKANGPLTKRISLEPDGVIKSDGSACKMARGTAERASISQVSGFAELIEQLGTNQAPALGRLRDGLPGKVKVTTKRALNGQARPDLIARTGANIIYEKGPAFTLLDYDRKGMPTAVAHQLKHLGGFWPALLSVLPALANVARVTRRSTSSGLYRADTGEQLPDSGGVHVYPVVQDATDIERFLKTLHARCWLAGLGWMMVSKAGQLLERSIIDRSVAGPERLCFEAGPLLKPPLKQASRRPGVVEGDVLDTAECRPLSVVEQAKLEDLKARERVRLAPEVARIRPEFIAQQAERLVKRGVSMQAAERAATRWCEGILLPSVELPFDDEDLAGCTVADVLVDPDRFVDETLADPLEGVEYGVCKARVMRRADGSLWIHSFAHGRTVYELMLDAASVRQAMYQAAPGEIIKVYTRLAVNADLDAEELAELRRLAKELSGVNLKDIDGALTAARQKHAEQRAKARREHSDVTRRDPRPLIPAPLHDAPWQPEMDTLNEVLGGVSEAKPPSRDIDGVSTCGRKHPVPELHAFTEANTEEEE